MGWLILAILSVVDPEGFSEGLIVATPIVIYLIALWYAPVTIIVGATLTYLSSMMLKKGYFHVADPSTQWIDDLLMGVSTFADIFMTLVLLCFVFYGVLTGRRAGGRLFTGESN